MNSGTIQKIATILRAIRRYGHLVGFLLLSLIFIALGIWAHGRIDDTTTIVFLFVAGVLGIVFTIWNFIRQGKKYTGSDNAMKEKVTYQDTSGDAVQFSGPTGATTDLTNQEQIAAVYPLMALGVVGVGFFGQTKVKNQENTIVLTKEYLVGLQIPITEGSKQGIGSAATLIGAAVGADAAYQNTMTSIFAGGELGQAVQEVLAKHSMVELTQKYYSYVLPLSSVESVTVRSVGAGTYRIKIVATNVSKEFGCKNAALVQSFSAGLQSLGVHIQQS